jgi:hypothetical protein
MRGAGFLISKLNMKLKFLADYTYPGGQNLVQDHPQAVEALLAFS